MSTVSLTNIFNFSRSLPKPFDSLPNKKVKVSSVYSNTTEATLCSSILKAINAACGCKIGKIEGAIGLVDRKGIAEYKSSIGDEFHLAVYDGDTGNVLASVYNRSTELTEVYVCHQSKRDGAAVVMAMLPKLLEDNEFSKNFDNYFEEYKAGFPDVTKASEYAAYLCDNAYRRIKDEKCPAYVKLNIDSSGNLSRISKTGLDSGTFTPHEVLMGEFGIFAKTERASMISEAKDLMAHADFCGQFSLGKRTLTAAEERLVPELPEWYVIPEEVIDICKHAQATTGKASQMRNFLLRGPAGTGKTMGAKAIAAGLGLPYVKYTCSAGTEIYDFIGQIFPDSEQDSEQENIGFDNSEKISFNSIAKSAKLPDLADMEYNPSGVYESITGQKKLNATTQECMELVINKILENAKSLLGTEKCGQNGGQRFSYIETDFIKAIKYGFVVEIQEPTTIVQPGVLVGLNSLLEQSGSITLPTGEVIKRHPDAVVVVTTNVSYEGCRGMNQSIIDRMSLVRDVELPTPEIMMQRAKSVTGATDDYQISKMVEVINNMADFCRRNSIGDGNVGMRGLIDWIESTAVTGDAYKSALYTIISKATSDEADRESLITSVLEPIFAPTSYKKSA